MDLFDISAHSVSNIPSQTQPKEQTKIMVHFSNTQRNKWLFQTIHNTVQYCGIFFQNTQLRKTTTYGPGKHKGQLIIGIVLAFVSTSWIATHIGWKDSLHSSHFLIFSFGGLVCALLYFYRLTGSTPSPHARSSAGNCRRNCDVLCWSSSKSTSMVTYWLWCMWDKPWLTVLFSSMICF